MFVPVCFCLGGTNQLTISTQEQPLSWLPNQPWVWTLLDPLVDIQVPYVTRRRCDYFLPLQFVMSYDLLMLVRQVGINQHGFADLNTDRAARTVCRLLISTFGDQVLRVFADNCAYFSRQLRKQHGGGPRVAFRMPEGLITDCTLMYQPKAKDTKVPSTAASQGVGPPTLHLRTDPLSV